MYENGIKMLLGTLSLKKLTSYAFFLRKLPEDVLRQNKAYNQERP